MRKILILCFVILFSPPAHAGFFHLSDYHNYGPLATRSQNPLYLLFLAETPERAAALLKKKEWGLSAETTFSNVFERNLQANGIGMDVDLELWRTALKGSYGITDFYNLGIEIPFLSFSGGFLDSFVQGYHHAFGFPNGGREAVNNGRFSYRVTRNGTTLYRTDQTSFGLGDLVVWNKLQLNKESRALPTLAVKASLKVPTGSAENGTGSGRPDFGLSLFAEKNIKRLRLYTQAGFVMAGGMEALDSILKMGMATFGQTFELNLTERSSLFAQITGNTPLFKNVGITELTYPVCDLTVGVAGDFVLKKTPKKIHYEVAFSEDVLSQGPSVDFSLLFKTGFVF